MRNLYEKLCYLLELPQHRDLIRVFGYGRRRCKWSRKCVRCTACSLCCGCQSPDSKDGEHKFCRWGSDFAKFEPTLLKLLRMRLAWLIYPNFAKIYEERTNVIVEQGALIEKIRRNIVSEKSMREALEMEDWQSVACHD